jgi:hypothetical protein
MPQLLSISAADGGICSSGPLSPSLSSPPRVAYYY